MNNSDHKLNRKTKTKLYSYININYLVETAWGKICNTRPELRDVKSAIK